MRCFCGRGRVGGGGVGRESRGGVLGVRMGLVMGTGRVFEFGGEWCRSCGLSVVVGSVSGSAGVCIFCGISSYCRCLCRLVMTCVWSLGALGNGSFVACPLIVWLEISILNPQNSCSFCVLETCARLVLSSCRVFDACSCRLRHLRFFFSFALCPLPVLAAAPRPQSFANVLFAQSPLSSLVLHCGCPRPAPSFSRSECSV